MATPHRALQSSRSVALYRRTSPILERSWRSSNAHTVFERIESSRLADLADWLHRATTHSFCYRWLTTEPEPEVIVIDLRETYTVAPFIALLDRLVDALAPAWHESALRSLTDRAVGLLVRAAQTKTGQVFVKLLAPPESPRDRRDSQ